MRLVIVSRLHLSYRGGGENWIREVARQASVLSEVSVLTSTLGQGRFSTDLSQGGSKIDYQTFETLGSTTFPDRAGLRLLRSTISDGDVVYFSYTPGGLEVALAQFQGLLRVPVIAGHHGVIRWPKFQRVVDGKTRAMFSVLGPRNLRLSKGFAAHHVQNNADRAELNEHGIARVFVIPSGVDCGSYRARLLPRTFTVLFLGTITYQKGVDLLPELVSKLDKLLPNYRLVVAGTGEDIHSLEILKQHPRVDVTGFVDEERKRELLATAHAFVLPSRFESFGLAAMEALASGTPVVSFNIPGPDEFVRDGANGFLVNSLEEMSVRILELYQLWAANPDAYDRFRAAATLQAQLYDWSLVFPKLWGMINTVSGGHPRIGGGSKVSPPGTSR
jgi:glycosyltransferase involved in cell wall biosynthesis